MFSFGIAGRKQQTTDPYGAPGSGRSTLISVVTIAVILFSWWLLLIWNSSGLCFCRLRNW